MATRDAALSDLVLKEQVAYYRARAGEYDEWFYRQGRYDRGPEFAAAWFAEIEQVAAALDAFHPAGRVLELAAGTGLWTERLARHAEEVTALDASPEALNAKLAQVGWRGAIHQTSRFFLYGAAEPA